MNVRSHKAAPHKIHYHLNFVDCFRSCLEGFRKNHLLDANRFENATLRLRECVRLGCPTSSMLESMNVIYWMIITFLFRIKAAIQIAADETH